MPREFPEEALEAIAKDCELAARDWYGDGSRKGRLQTAEKWAAKAATIRQAIDAYRATTNAAPITRRQRLDELVRDTAEKMDFRKLAAGDRE